MFKCVVYPHPITLHGQRRYIGVTKRNDILIIKSNLIRLKPDRASILGRSAKMARRKPEIHAIKGKGSSVSLLRTDKLMLKLDFYL